MAEENNGNSFLWFLAGLGVGAVIGVLYAPKSGAETREAIRAKFEEGKEFVTAKAGEAREQTSDWMQRGRDVLRQQQDQFRSAFEAGKQAYQEATTTPETPGPQKV
ncbi:MAG TPA: YtxH domain-containing protein [Terriglobales bacterium]|nr:YtxH domain-containing protein [Terriglobales bacterium]